jgi:hypothetical protein
VVPHRGLSIRIVKEAVVDSSFERVPRMKPTDPFLVLTIPPPPASCSRTITSPSVSTAAKTQYSVRFAAEHGRSVLGYGVPCKK